MGVILLLWLIIDWLLPLHSLFWNANCDILLLSTYQSMNWTIANIDLLWISNNYLQVCLYCSLSYFLILCYLMYLFYRCVNWTFIGFVWRIWCAYLFYLFVVGISLTPFFISLMLQVFYYKHALHGIRFNIFEM